MSPLRPGCSEFPNDNSALHHGAVWVCRTPRGPARAILRAARAEPPADGESAHAPPPVAGEVGEGRTERNAEAPVETRGGFSDLVEALQRVALERGATRAAAALVLLLSEERIDGGALDARQRAELLTRGMADAANGEIRLSEAFLVALRAWRKVLRAESDDLSACGPRMLDEWAADLLGALLGISGEDKQLRRDLRQRGVAAFGMLAEVA